MSLKKLCICVLFLLVSTNVLAKGAEPQISEVMIDLDNNQLIISGSGFDNPDVKFGGYEELLTLDSDLSDENFLVVDLPIGVGAGDYRLTVSQGKKGKDRDDYDLTIGAVGPQGEQGLQGPVGPQGPVGADGATGPQGVAGPQGAQGPTGSDGDKGDTGDTGPQGVAGPIGPQGPAGADGTNGVDGSDGATGPQGVAGPQGPQGLPGQTASVSGGLYGLCTYSYIQSTCESLPPAACSVSIVDPTQNINPCFCESGYAMVLTGMIIGPGGRVGGNIFSCYKN